MSDTVILDPGGTPGTRTNLITNPSARTSVTTGWTNTGLTTFSVSSTTSDPVLLANQIETAFHAVGNSTGDMATTTFTATSGDVVQLSIMLSVTSLSASAVQLRAIDPNGSTVKASVDRTTTGTYAVLSTSFTASSTGTHTLQVRQSGSGAMDVRFTAVLVEVAATLGGYFDGDSPTDSVAVVNRWTGTPSQSSSVREIVRQELDITQWMHTDGTDWGTAEIAAYQAEANRGQVPVDYRVPNRQITIPLTLRTRGAVSFETIRRQLQAKVAVLQAEGGTLQRTVGSGVVVYADIVNASLRLGGSWLAAERGIDADAELTLECLPELYGSEKKLGDLAGDFDNTFGVFDDVQGDTPARARLVLTEVQGHDKRGVIAGARSANYSADSTAQVVYAAEDLTPLDEATVDGILHVVTHDNVGTAWVPVLSTDIDADGPLTHRGSYRVWARCSYSGDQPQVRLVWDVGDLVQPNENPAVALPTSDSCLVDLGEVRLDPAPAGTHRWRGYVQAKTPGSSSTVSIEKLTIVPADDWYAVLRAPATRNTGLSAFLARDEFTGTTSGGTLNTRTPALGAAWATSGATGDFTFADAGGLNTNDSEVVYRSSSGSSFRYGVFGSAETDMTMSATIAFGYTTGLPFVTSPATVGVIARWTDSNNYARLVVVPSQFGYHYLELYKVVAGTATLLKLWPLAASSSQYQLPMELSLTILASGAVKATFNGTVDSVELTTTDSVFATGGTLASGKGGIIDAGDGTNTVYRWYGSVAVTDPPPSPAVMYASQQTELRWDGMIRRTTTGDAAGPVASVDGKLFRLPVSGLEGRSVQVFVRTSRGDLDQLDDENIDAFAASIYYRPCWLTVPDDT